MKLLWSGERPGTRKVCCSEDRSRVPPVLQEVAEQGGVTVALIVPLDGFILRGPEPSKVTRRVVSQTKAVRLDGPGPLIDEILSMRVEGRR